MKVIVYQISQIDKQFLALANHKRHKITIINVPLDETTVYFARSKDVVIITGDGCSVSYSILKKLVSSGVRYIITWLKDPFTGDLPEIKHDGLQWTHIRNTDPSDAYEVISVINRWQKDDDDHN
ncbi:hypothetical protein DDI74_02740 [Chryseobacterium gleum]|uniref:hypothetical protein n=1 Tax=Chryseobacterium gleum TaxID=250 RepID=UPI00103E6BDE|nr:hypothetical protein [Chryseobacterium gleum]QBJ85240.1 hypothetical protein DDI74_02740 [Chryseobacterium gleum]